MLFLNHKRGFGLNKVVEKLITVKLEDGNVRTGELPVNFWGSLEEDCKRHR
jgi:hypothetical protein